MDSVGPYLFIGSAQLSKYGFYVTLKITVPYFKKKKRWNSFFLLFVTKIADVFCILLIVIMSF